MNNNNHFLQPLSSSRLPSFEQKQEVEPQERPSWGLSIQSKTPQAPPGLYLGDVPTQQGVEQFSIPHDIRLKHMHVIGATGTGKTKFIEHLIRQDISKGRGVCLIDPHGDLYADVLKYCIENRCHDRVIPFNPSEKNYVIGLNPFQFEGDYTAKAKQIREACGKAWGMTDFHETPRLSRWLFNIFYALLELKGSFVDALHLASLSKNNPRRIELIKRLQHPEVKRQFIDLVQGDDRYIREMMESSYNRIFEFLNNDTIRKIFSQEKVMDFKSLMGEGKILLCNLSTRGHLISGEDRSLLGALIVNEVYNSAVSRSKKERNPFVFYIDEFAHFVSEDIAHGLEEARKFGLGYLLAHQDLMQLEYESKRLYASVMTNARTKVVFGGLRDEDREVLSKEVFAPDFNLKSVKDEVYQTKTRSRLEKRTVASESETEGLTHGTSENESQNEGFSTGSTESRSSGGSQGTSQTTSEGSSHGGSRNSGRQWGENTSHSTGYSNPQYAGASETQNRSNSRGHSSGNSSSEGSSWSNNRSQSNGQSSSASWSQSEGSTQSENKGTSRGTGRSESSSRSTTRGTSETWVTVQDEFQELSSRAFWTHSELLEQAKSFLAKLGTAKAVVKVLSEAALPLSVPHIEDVRIKKKTYDGFLKAVSTQLEFYIPEIDAVLIPLAVEGEVLELKPKKPTRRGKRSNQKQKTTDAIQKNTVVDDFEV